MCEAVLDIPLLVQNYSSSLRHGSVAAAWAGVCALHESGHGERAGEAGIHFCTPAYAAFAFLSQCIFTPVA